jgi:uncharacterized protein YigE (DUF2233 family)
LHPDNGKPQKAFEMKIGKLIFLLCLLLPFAGKTQSRGDNEFNFHGHSYSVFIIKIDSTLGKKFKLLQNTAHVPHSNFISTYINNDPNTFLINGSPWDSVYWPLGLFVSNGQTINPLNLNDGNQMGFYLKPNGVFAVNDKGAFVTESSKASAITNIRLAVQSGPMLVIDGRIHDKFDPNSKNRNLRCGAGIYEEGGASYLVFAASNEAVSLYEFASLFKDNFKCANALCLQSAGCIMQMPFIKRSSAMDNSPVGNYIMFSNHD